MWFTPSVPTDHPPLFQFRDIPDTDVDDQDPLPFPLPVASVPAAAAVPIFDSDDLTIPLTPATGASLHAAITRSADRLFFASYCPAGTLRPRWYLVQVDLLQSLEASPDYATTGRYYCHFLGCHPDDASLPDPLRRWWLLWHRFTRSSDGIVDFDTRILFNPATPPGPSSYIAWAEVLPLLDPTVCLLGSLPFNDPSSNPPGRTSSFCQLLPFDLWTSLITLCVPRGILPPVLSTPPTAHSRWTRLRR